MNVRRFTVLALILVLGAVSAFAQSIVSGDLTGTVTDPQGAVVPKATLTLVSTQFGTTQSTTTSAEGTYRFALLKPGIYKITATATGFSAVTKEVTVVVGQVINVPMQVLVQGQKEVVEVTAEAPLLHTENANVTAGFDRQQIEMLPNPGQDLTTYALTAPGVTLSTGAGYGNFTAFGLPATSNLWTINGNDTTDPFFGGLQNTGATNNMLGANEIQEAAVVTNGYTGQYGRFAGANVNFTTKSGGNSFHGNAQWLWNGRALNANDYFNNALPPGETSGKSGDRPFGNSNQWAGSFGGPIIKDKLFFFYDNEGLRYVLPTTGQTFVPTPAFQNEILNNYAGTVTANNKIFYNQIFGIYNGAPNIAQAVPVSSGMDPYDPTVASGLGCGDFAGTPSVGNPALLWGRDLPCSAFFRSSSPNKNTEWLMGLTVDWVATQNDKFKFRWTHDRGTQATYTDPLNPLFNAQSVQPQDSGQLTYTKIFSPTLVNQFIASGTYYSAMFTNVDQAASRSLFPTTILFYDGLMTDMGGQNYSYPQGRNVSQIGIVDDLSWTLGKHNLKFGVNYRKNWMTDFTPFTNDVGELFIFDMTDFVNGKINDYYNGSSRLTQRFSPNYKEAGFKFYSLGMYAQDEWAATPKLKLTLSVRADRNSNETCTVGGVGCISRPRLPWSDIAHDAAIPYNQVVQTGLENVFESVEPIVFSPRFGFAYNIHKDTVLRGGMGLFTDLYPAYIGERYVRNLPFVTSFNVAPPGGYAGAAGSTYPMNPYDNLAANGIFAVAQAVDQALINGYQNGSTYTMIKNSLAPVPFSTPTLALPPGKTYVPKYLEWNFMVEHQLTAKLAVSANYVGNHGYDLFVNNPTVNSYCSTAVCPAGSFVGLPSATTDPRFNQTSVLTNSGWSNYNGLTFALAAKPIKGFSGNFSYTWSHSLDAVSNGGITLYSGQAGGDSLMSQIDFRGPNFLNYSNSDYDFRHSLNANWIWELPFKSSNSVLNQIIGGWSYSGSLYFRTGEPYSVYFSNVTSKLSNASGTLLLGTFLGGTIPGCGGPGMDPNNDPYQCLQKTMFNTLGTTPSYGNPARNFFRGPGFTDVNMSIHKSFKLTESGMKLAFGLNAYNAFNHPNFINPVGDLASSQFGQITATTGPASSPYGNFQGAAANGRTIQTEIKFSF